MVEIIVHIGTFQNGNILYYRKEEYLLVPTQNEPDGEHISLNEIVSIEKATDENIKSLDENWDLAKAKSQISDASNWGAAFGIIGIVGEVLYKGVKTTFVMKLKNGMNILGTVGENYFNEISPTNE